MKILFIFILAGSLAAGGEYVLYTKSDGAIIMHGPDVSVRDGTVAMGTKGAGPCATNTHALATVPVFWPTNAVNISQLSGITNVAMADIEYNYARWTDREHRLLTLIVREINILRVKARLPARTKQQMIDALKDL